MTTNHQLEMQQILRDAAAKISKFKESIESRQNQVKIYEMNSTEIDLTNSFIKR